MYTQTFQIKYQLTLGILVANVLHAKALAEHYPQFTTVSIYPGAIFTDLYLKMDTKF